MKPLKQKVSFTLDNDVLEVLRRLAEKDDRSTSQYVNKILREYLVSRKHLKKRAD